MSDAPLRTHAHALDGKASTLEDLEAWARGFAPFGRETCVRVALACAEMALPYWERTFPEGLLPGQQLEAVRAWLRRPGPEGRERVHELLESSDAASDWIDPRDFSKDAEGSAANACAWAAGMVTDDDLSLVYVAARAAVHALEAAGEVEPERQVYERIRNSLDAFPDDAPDG